MFSIYIHIPFCRTKCKYCDFPSIAAKENIYSEYVKALRSEIAQVSKKLSVPEADTIYFGGGTPSLLSAQSIAAIIADLKQYFQITDNVEVTLEANPGTVDLAKLIALHQVGVNRLSFGIQATQDSLLQAIGRIHNFTDVQNAVHYAKEAGFSNLNMDLMYGLPQQTLSMLKESTDWVLAQKPQHISIYGLQIEPRTLFFKLYTAGKLDLPDDDTIEAMYDFITTFLPQRGYSRYEISNFARPGFTSRHNLAYWQDKSYIGFGCAAHSYYNFHRLYNTYNVYEYIKTCNNSLLPIHEEEKFDITHWMEEFCFLALRTTVGIDKKKFTTNFHKDIHMVYDRVIAKLIAKKLLEETDSHIFLTALGMKFGNIVFEEFLL